jgi:choloylglycine hydrolase
VNLEPYDIESRQIGDVKFNPAGSGSGWLGLPGDWTPPSRFVRTAMIVHSADKAKNAAEAVNLAEHILNAVDIPRGVIKTKGPVNKDLVDYTQWIVIKDLTNRVLYFRSYDNLTLRKVDMKKLSFKPGALTKVLPINSKNEVVDVTGKMI